MLEATLNPSSASYAPVRISSFLYPNDQTEEETHRRSFINVAAALHGRYTAREHGHDGRVINRRGVYRLQTSKAGGVGSIQVSLKVRFHATP
jgi:hypothetical protein